MIRRLKNQFLNFGQNPGSPVHLIHFEINSENTFAQYFNHYELILDTIVHLFKN